MLVYLYSVNILNFVSEAFDLHKKEERGKRTCQMNKASPTEIPNDCSRCCRVATNSNTGEMLAGNAKIRIEAPPYADRFPNK